MTRYEKLQGLIEKFKDEERKLISYPGNKWAEHCFIRRSQLENELNNLTLEQAGELV